MVSAKWIVAWVLGGIVAAIIVAAPVAAFRLEYNQAKRLREVAPGRLYRSGQLTADGFRDAVAKYGIRTVVNLQSSDDDGTLRQDWSDPLIPASAFGGAKRKESEVVAAARARYVQVDCNSLDQTGPDGYPPILDDVYRVFDDEANYPILVHCKAGLHRTGLVVAAYRMEYERRTQAQALDELRANGFGTFKSTDDNDYIRAGVTDFHTRKRGTDGRPLKPSPKPAEGER